MKRTLLLASIASIFAFNAQALDVKPYVGLDYVRSDMDLDVKLEGENVSRYLEDNLNAFAVSAGAKINNNFGLEAFYQQSEDGEKTVGFLEKTETNYKAYGVDFIGYLPLGCENKLELLGAIGIGQYDAEAKYKVAGLKALNLDDDGLGVRLGAGAQYNFNEHFAARVMARYVDTDVDGLDNMVDLTAGVRYTF